MSRPPSPRPTSKSPTACEGAADRPEQLQTLSAGLWNRRGSMPSASGDHGQRTPFGPRYSTVVLETRSPVSGTLGGEESPPRRGRTTRATAQSRTTTGTAMTPIWSAASATSGDAEAGAEPGERGEG